MNVASLCKAVPACFPHEMLGYERDSLAGTFISLQLLSKLAKEEEEQMNSPIRQHDAARNARMSKFKRNK